MPPKPVSHRGQMSSQPGPSNQTQPQGLTFEFFINGPPESTTRAFHDVPSILKEMMQNQIAGWERKKPGAWANTSRTGRCVEPRITKINLKTNAFPADPHHSFACDLCTQRKALCVMVKGALPVVLPLEPELRHMGAMHRDVGYYIR